MPIAAIYPRVSHPSQVAKGQSLKIQERKLLARAKALGFDVGPGDIFIEAGITGKNDNRPEYNRLLAAIMEGKYQAVFVYDISRLTRTDSREEQGRIIKILSMAGCDLYTESTHYDLTNPQSRFMFGINAEVALYDNSMRAQKVKEGREEARQKGNNPGQAPATGYVKFYKPDGSLIYKLDKKEIKPVKLAYEMALQGAGGTRILKELTRKGFRTKNDTPLSLSHVYQWLQNPTYAGYVHIGMSRGSKMKEPGMWPANFLEGTVVTLEEWERVQTLMMQRKTGKAPTRFPLSNILHCPSCGEPMHGTYKRGGQGNPRTRYYACQNTPNEPDKYCPNTQGRSIMMNVAHKMLLDAFPEILDRLGMAFERQVKAYQAQIIEMSKEVDEASELKKELSRTERKLMNHLREQGEDPSEYRRKIIKGLEAEAKSLKTKIHQLQSQNTPPAIPDLGSLRQLLPNIEPADNQILDDLIKPLFTKVNYTREGTHRKYTFRLTSVVLQWGEILVLKRDYTFSQ